DSMRRTPGFGGFTFAVDLEFPHKAPVTGQMLANQAAQWSLKLTPDATLKLTLNDETFESAKLPLGSTLCNKLVLTTYYLRSKLNAEIDKSIVTLWLNGKPVIDVSQPSPAEFPADIQQPTYLGQNPEGGELFEGRLGKPYLFNEFYYRDDPWQVGRDIARIENLLCQ
ncbi:MAG: hypothetical protein KDI30_13640, partial [Pseudomonadales bacterium]|nr:hypothetical protein [Pseudomonadales bacterium]